MFLNNKHPQKWKGTEVFNWAAVTVCAIQNFELVHLCKSENFHAEI